MTNNEESWVTTENGAITIRERKYCGAHYWKDGTLAEYIQSAETYAERTKKEILELEKALPLLKELTGSDIRVIRPASGLILFLTQDFSLVESVEINREYWSSSADYPRTHYDPNVATFYGEEIHEPTIRVTDFINFRGFIKGKEGKLEFRCTHDFNSRNSKEVAQDGYFKGHLGCRQIIPYKNIPRHNIGELVNYYKDKGAKAGALLQLQESLEKLYSIPVMETEEEAKVRNQEERQFFKRKVRKQ